MSESNHSSVKRKAEIFKSLHEQSTIFVCPNPWDAGSAKVLEGLGFRALATTSAGLAYTLGVADGYGSIKRERTLQNALDIVAAVNLPVSADMENGYGDDPEACAEMILLAARTGLAGGSIEDATGRPSDPIYPFEQSVARIKAAVEAKRTLSYPFTLTARAENLIHGRPDLTDTINRLVAYADAGADVLFAPGLKTKKEISDLVKAVAPKPVNVVMGLSDTSFSVRELEDLGVRRISIGSSLARAAYGGFIRAAKEIIDKGTFHYSNDAAPYSELNNIFQIK